MHYITEFIGIISLNHWSTESRSSPIFSKYRVYCLWGTSTLTLAAGGLFEVLVLSSWRRRSQEESLHTHNNLLWPSESAIYADIHLGLYGLPVIFSAACLAELRQRAERHLCFNINVTQASVLRECTGIFVWNKFHTKTRWQSEVDNSLDWVEASLPYTANLRWRLERWPARNTYTEHTLKCTFSKSLDIIDVSRIFRAWQGLALWTSMRECSCFHTLNHVYLQHYAQAMAVTQ